MQSSNPILFKSIQFHPLMFNATHPNPLNLIGWGWMSWNLTRITWWGIAWIGLDDAGRNWVTVNLLRENAFGLGWSGKECMEFGQLEWTDWIELDRHWNVQEFSYWIRLQWTRLNWIWSELHRVVWIRLDWWGLCLGSNVHSFEFCGNPLDLIGLEIALRFIMVDCNGSHHAARNWIVSHWGLDWTWWGWITPPHKQIKSIHTKSKQTEFNEIKSNAIQCTEPTPVLRGSSPNNPTCP